MKVVSLPPVSSPRLWQTAQILGLVATLGLIGGLVAWPNRSLHLLWDIVIPVLPAVFVLNPLTWRNVCPLATLNSMVGVRAEAPPPDIRTTRQLWWVGIALLGVLVPARRFLFNSNGPALAGTIVAVAIIALAAGLFAARRSGFCNTLCPVLPVEKLYGQRPLIDVGNARCTTCTGCTHVGCIELARLKTIPQTIGPTRRTTGWLTTPFGAFAAAFPGFIIGYFTTSDGPLSTAPQVYLQVGALAAGSYLLVTAVVLASGIAAERALRSLGWLSVATYYSLWLATR
ncbi:MAG TPA: hypothetical protein PLL69_02980 [Gemmatimonadales bacterium]|nr:hypothetical protein [Gemmatimonadales bacterium]